MQIDRNSLELASEAGIISEKESQALWKFLLEHNKDIPSFNFTHILYYFGGLLAIGAMTIFMNLGWDIFDGFGILFLSLIYAALGIAVAQHFYKNHLYIPAGILATFVVALTPLAIYGLQRGFGWLPEDFSYVEFHRVIHWQWIFMEVGTLLVAVIMFFIYHRPFLLLPIAFILWYISMDLVPLLYQGSSYLLIYDICKTVSMCIGLITLLLAFIIDLRSTSKLDYAFHLYLFGLLAFWGGLTALSSDNDWSKLGYCAINLVLIIIGAALARRVFVIFGGLGVAIYLGDLSYHLFRDSYLFPIILTLIGFAIIYLGLLWNKHGDRIGNQLRSYLPRDIQELVARRLD